MNSGDGKADPSVLAVFQDYIKLMPLVAEANQMSEELKKVRLENGKIPAPERTSENRFNAPLTPIALHWLHGVDTPDTWAWRGQVLCPRPHSELVTGPQPTPGPPQSQPRVCSFHLWPPRLWDHQDPRPTLARHGHPTPDCPPEALSGCRHLGGFSATEKAWAGIRSLVTQDPNHRETCMRFSHFGEAYTC